MVRVQPLRRQDLVGEGGARGRASGPDVAHPASTVPYPYPQTDRSLLREPDPVGAADRGDEWQSLINKTIYTREGCHEFLICRQVDKTRKKTSVTDQPHPGATLLLPLTWRKAPSKDKTSARAFSSSAPPPLLFPRSRSGLESGLGSGWAVQYLSYQRCTSCVDRCTST